MASIIDLHIHTNISDGKLTPLEVLDNAFINGVNIISIADHDTIDAYTPELFDYANKKNIKLIPAVEISTKTDKAGIHVLGYNINLNKEVFKSKLATLRNARHDYLYKVAKKIENLGYLINTEELDKIEAVTKAHIALDIINNSQNQKILIKNFNHIPSKGEFIETIMNEGCPAYVKKETISPKEAANLIREAGGKVILAHPVAYQYEDNLEENDILNIIKDMNADGIEAYYIYVDRNNNKIDDISKWLKFAKDNNLSVTIGSDYHNSDGIRPEIGLINENININEKTVKDILNILNL